MTTDTLPKAASRQVQIGGRTVTVTGISKGAGMIRPNMATMLGFMATDAVIAPHLLETLVKQAADQSFNRITIDGDTSTNDSFVLIATHRAGHAAIADLASAESRTLSEAVFAVASELAQAIVRDGEGATKFIRIQVQGGRDEAECRLVAYTIAHSPLVKTAFFASDPNLGRILAAVGYAGIADLDQGLIDLYLDDVHVARQGGRHPAYQEADGQRVMKQSEITVRVDLHRGAAVAEVWTCDLSPRLRQHQRRLSVLTRPGLPRLAANDLWRDPVYLRLGLPAAVELDPHQLPRQPGDDAGAAAHGGGAAAGHAHADGAAHGRRAAALSCAVAALGRLAGPRAQAAGLRAGRGGGSRGGCQRAAGLVAAVAQHGMALRGRLRAGHGAHGGRQRGADRADAGGAA